MDGTDARSDRLVADLGAVFEAVPGANLVLASDEPTFVILAANSAYLSATMRAREEVVGRALFDAFPDNPGDPSATGVRNLRESLMTVLRTKRPHAMPVQRYDVRRPASEGGGFEERYWEPLNTPVLGDDGRVVYLVHHVVDVTEQYRARAAMREGEARLRALAKASGAVLYRMNADWSEMRPLDGEGPVASNGGSIGDWMRRNVPPSEHAALRERIAHCVATKGVFEMEHRVYRPDRSIGWTRSRAVPMLDDRGRIVEWVGTAEDVTERRGAEAALRASEERSLTILEGINDAFYAVDAEWRFTYVNRKAEELWGRRREGLVGRHFWTEFPQAVGSESYRMHLKAMSERTPVRYEAVSPVLGRWVDVSIYPGERGGLSCYFRDVTDRKRIEEALRESEERFAAFMDNSPTASWITDADGRVEYISRTYAQSFALPAADVVGRTPREMYPPEFAERYMASIREVAESGRMVEVTEWAPRPDGSVGEFLVYKFPLRQRSGRVLVGGVAVDVTARRQAERDRETLLAGERAARAEAERASAAKSEFLAALSHELRTPLTPVLLTVSLMESHPGLPKELREDVAAIRRNVELESRLIGDLLDLTRIERGKLHLDVRDVDLHLIVRSAIDICQREASAKLHVELGAQHHFVRGDGTRLQQVFWNLISNAIKFTGGDGTITVRTVDVPEGVRVDVADTGVGIDASVLPRLFTAFEQGEVRAARQQAGLGLGLAISKRLVEMHGGRIGAASEGRGRGATFTVELPAAGHVARTPVAPRQPVSVPAASRSLHVLLVEDHEPTLRVMERLLRHMGHRVTGVTSVASATAAANQGGFDLIISDLGLPDGSGLDLMRRVRDRYAGRAIALTGYGMEEDIAASREAGFAEHLTKPVDLAALDAAIRRLR